MPEARCDDCGEAFAVVGTEPAPAPRCRRCGRPPRIGRGQGAGPVSGISGADRLRDKRCVVCGRLLTLHRIARGICDTRECQRGLYRQQLPRIREEAAAARRRAEVVRRKAERAREASIRSLVSDPPESYPLALVPSNELPLVPLPEARRQEFCGFLRGVIGEALEDGTADRAASSIPRRQEPTPPETRAERAVLGNACAVCRGYCCQDGGDHAYLSADTIRRYRAEHPGADREVILAAYRSHVPEVSYEGSCIYHTETGCALPDEMRSDVARAFYCEELARFREELQRSRTRRGFAVAVRSGEILRGAIIDETGTRYPETDERTHPAGGRTR